MHVEPKRHYLHTTTIAAKSTATTTVAITTTEAKGIEMKLSRNVYDDVKLTQNTFCA